MENIKKIYKYEFNQILRSIPEISPEERKFLNGYFGSDLVDGLTKFELKEKIALLKFNTEDSINRSDAKKIKRKLLEHFDK